MSFSSKSAVLAALIDGQRKRLLNEATWREEDPLPPPSSEPAEPASPPAAPIQPRPEPQLNLPHLGDIWDRMQQEKQTLGAINLYRMGQGAQAGEFGPRGLAVDGEFASPSVPPLSRHETFTTWQNQLEPDVGHGRGGEKLQLARVPQWMADAYFRLHPQERRNLEGNVQRLIGGRLDSEQVTTILKDVLAEDKTGIDDLQAFGGVVPTADGRVQLTPAQREIVDRFVNGLPDTPLNRSAVRLYREGVASGRIKVKK